MFTFVPNYTSSAIPLFHKNSKERAGISFAVLSQFRNTIGWFMKTHRPIKRILHFLITDGFKNISRYFKRFKYFQQYAIPKLIQTWTKNEQKQPSRGFLKKRYSENTKQIYRRTLVPNCDFNKVAKQLYWNHSTARMFSCKSAVYFQKTFS